MQKLKYWLLLLLSLFILVVALRVFFTQSTSDAIRQGEFRVDSNEEISRVRLQDHTGNIVFLEKTNEGVWILNEEYLANMPAIRDLLSTLRRMDVRRPVSLDRSEFVKEHLNSEGIRVEVYAVRYRIRLPGNIRWLPRNKKIRDFLVGADLETGEGTYMQGMHAQIPFEIYLPGVRSGIREVFIPKEYIWRDPLVLSLAPGQIKVIELRCRNKPHESFSIYFDSEQEYRLYDRYDQPPAEVLIREERLERYINAFLRLHYERMLPLSSGTPPEDIFSDEAFMEMEILDADGRKTTLAFYKRFPPKDGSLVSEKRPFDPNRFYLRINDGDFALAKYYVFQPVMRPLSWFTE